MTRPDPARVLNGRMVASVEVQRSCDGAMLRVEDAVAIEEPLEIRLAYELQGRRVVKPISITMRTPGADAELAAGFLVGEGLLRESGEILSAETPAPNQVVLELRNGAEVEIERLQRNFYTTSSCGICGRASLDALQEQIPAGPPGDARISAGLICELPSRAAAAQDAFAATGGLHAAALFTLDGTCLRVREDVGRHNALDKLVGSLFLEGKLPLTETVLLLSGRASFELMQKAILAGIPVIAAIGAPSSLAVELALRYQRTLIGFLRGTRFNVYSGVERIVNP
jgi:FdhD protein